MDLKKEALALHKKYKGKIGMYPKLTVHTRHELSLVYTPGVAEVSRLLTKHPEKTNEYTYRGNTVAVISDGSAVLGLGNIGPEAALPVMEGKCLIFKEFAQIDAIPIVLKTQDTLEIIHAVEAISPSFAGINLEDIAAPKCFQIEEELKKRLSIPVIHDDQWGAAVAVLAALYNTLILLNLNINKAKIVILGAGAAGSAVVKLLHKAGAQNIIVCDSQGIIYKGRDTDHFKQELAHISNSEDLKGTLEDALKDANVFIGLSKGGVLKKHHIKQMGPKPVIFALANPDPEITSKEAHDAGVFVYASGRSDFPNQINNALVYPGVFRGVLDHHIPQVTVDHLIKVSQKLASLVVHPRRDYIIPSLFDKNIVMQIADVFV